MGSAASKGLSRAVSKSRSALVTDAVKEKIKQESIRSAPRETAPSRDSQVTAQLQKKPIPHHRKTTAEWAETLKTISGAITSSSWEGEVKPHARNRTEEGRHSAQRSDVTNEKLPTRAAPGAQGDTARSDLESVHNRTTGRLTQNQVLALFNLRRKDPATWTAARVAERFGLNEKDVDGLLKFSRTYMGRMDDDGHLRGYYKTDQDDTIMRFERD